MRKSRGAWLAFVAGVVAGLVFAVGPSWAARNSSGTYSLPSGHPVVTGTAISSTVFNNTMNDIKTEITDSLSRSGKGPMLAPLELQNGTKSVPSLSFDEEPDTGLFLVDAGVVGVTANGTHVCTYVSNGIHPHVDLKAVTVSTNVTDGDALTVNGNGAGDAIQASGSLGGVAVHGVGGVGAAGGKFSTSLAADSSNRRDSIVVLNGDIDMAGTVDPGSSTSISDTITPLHFPKVWANITGGASPAVNGGVNVDSVSCGTNEITVTVAADFADTNYAIFAQTNAADTMIHVANQAAGSFRIGASLHDGTTVDLCSGSPVLYVMAIGAQ